MGIRIPHLFERHNTTNVSYLKFTRVLLGIASTISSSIKGVEFSPNSGPGIRVMKKINTIVDLKYNVVLFTHNGNDVRLIISPENQIINSLFEHLQHLFENNNKSNRVNKYEHYIRKYY